jgi:two-component system alkaline phosphatase synthesis response regulator PhoP
MNKRILLVEDEAGLVLTLTDRLNSEGYQVETAGDGEAGLEMIRQDHYDLILLDIMLPQKNGFDVCRDMRRNGIETPVIMLTARGQVFDKVLGLKLGADDYLTKPFEMAELLARIEARLRRTEQSVDNLKEVVRFGNVKVDLRKAELTRNQETIELSAREFQLLRYLIEHQGDVLSRDELLNEVWGYDSIPTTRTVDVHVAWLRQKVEDNPRYPRHILTIHGLGYKFVA